MKVLIYDLFAFLLCPLKIVPDRIKIAKGVVQGLIKGWTSPPKPYGLPETSHKIPLCYFYPPPLTIKKRGK